MRVEVVTIKPRNARQAWLILDLFKYPSYLKWLILKLFYTAFIDSLIDFMLGVIKLYGSLFSTGKPNVR
jgi:hypothetical protein